MADVYSNCGCANGGDTPAVRVVSGNDLTVEALVSIYDKDKGYYAAFDLSGASDVRMRIVGAYSKVEGENVTVSGSKAKALFKAGRYGAGDYGVEITFTRGQESFRVFERGLFSVVRDSGEASLGTSAEGGSGEGMNISVDVRSRTLRVGQVSGITDYNLLENRPSIGGVILEGDRRPSDLGMYSRKEADAEFETKSHAADTFQTKESAAEADKRVQGMLDGKVDKEPGKGLSANDLTDERAGKVDKLKMDGRANEYLNGAGTYSRPVRQGYGVSVEDDNSVSVDPQVIARQSDVASVAADLAAQKAKEQGDIDRANAAMAKEEADRKAAVAALQSLIDILNSDSNVDGSVKKTVADAIARVVAGAPEDFDTLKEIADYIASDKTGAAQMAAAISQLQTLTEAHTEKITKIEQLLQEGYTFMGVATPKTIPSTSDQKVFYIANGKGTYTNFGGIEVADGEVVILYYDTAWHKVATGIASEADAILGMAHGDKVNVPLEFVTDGRLTEKGTISSSSGSKVTDFIAINSRNKYYLSNYIYANYDNGVCYYSDANEDSFIGSQFNANDLGNVGMKALAEGELAVPTNARYVRIGTRNVTYINATTLLVRYAQESMSMLSAKRIESRLNQQENAINALYPYIEHSDSVNIFNKNNVDEIVHKYISSKNIIIDNDISVLSNSIIKIEDCDGINNTYIFKYLGTSDVMAMKLLTLKLIFANDIVAGENVVWNDSDISQKNGIQGYSINTGKSSAYLWVSFRLSTFNYDNIQNTLHDILDNIVIIKQASTDIVYPSKYVPYTDKKFVVENESPIPADLTSNSADGIISIGMVDKNGHAIGQRVTFNVGGGLEADQLNVITSITYKLQPSVLSSEGVVLGAGWSGSLEDGYTHTSGNAEALEFTLASVPNLAKVLITFDVQGLSDSNDIYISTGDSALIKSYNGSTQVVTGLIYAGGNLKVTPTNNFAGTITNLKCRVLDDNGTETYKTSVNNVYCQRNSLVAGYWNVFIGGKETTASKMQDGTRNIAIGEQALNAMVVGNRNVAIGTFSMPKVTEGENNIAIGSDSIYPVKRAMNSISIGKGTMSGKSVENCVALGYGAMGLWNSEFIRDGCTAIGAMSAPGVINGNTHVGYRAGVNTKGAYNTSIGYNSLGIGTRSSIDIVGENLTCVGHDASVANNDTAKAANNSTALGYGATITKSNQVVIGNKQIEEVILGGKRLLFNNDNTVSWETIS